MDNEIDCIDNLEQKSETYLGFIATVLTDF